MKTEYTGVKGIEFELTRNVHPGDPTKRCTVSACFKGQLEKLVPEAWRMILARSMR